MGVGDAEIVLHTVPVPRTGRVSHANVFEACLYAATVFGDDRQLACAWLYHLKAILHCSPQTLHKPHSDTDASKTEDGAEARMRQALGRLGTAKPVQPEAPRRTTYQARPGAGRHRFRQDGEVPVVRISLAEGSRGEGTPAPCSCRGSAGGGRAGARGLAPGRRMAGRWPGRCRC